MAGFGEPDLDTVDAAGLSLGIVATRWHAELVDQMVDRAQAAAQACGGVEGTVLRGSGLGELPLVGPAVAPAVRGAVTGLFASQFRPLGGVAVLLLHDKDAAEEIAQDAFVALHQRWGQLRDPDKAVASLRQSVVNRARSVMRHRGVVDRFVRRQSG